MEAAVPALAPAQVQVPVPEPEPALVPVGVLGQVLVL
jgi:hypothetical protein